MRLRALLLVLIASGPAAAQVVSPPPPKIYHAEIRYRIDTDRDSRVRIFRAMEAELKALGFAPDLREDADLDILDPNADRLSGTIASDKLTQLRRVTAVQAVLVRPEDLTIPDDPKKPVSVNLTIAGGLDLTTQRALHEEVIDRLMLLGFVNGYGYDDKDFTRVRGTIPAGQVMNLLKDLRGLPAGWLLQGSTRAKLPLPIRDVLPIRLVEVLSYPDSAPPLPSPKADSPKYSFDLRVNLADAAWAGKPFRVEAEMSAPIGNLTNYRLELGAQHPGVMLEGIVGLHYTYRVENADALKKFAESPEIRSLRVPPQATNTVKPASQGTSNVLQATGIAGLQNRGYRGQGRSIVIIGSGFDATKLSKNAVIFDLTPEISPTFEPLVALPGYDATAAATAASAAAPDAKLILVRVNPAAFHQVLTVARAVRGDLTLSQAQAARAEKMLREYDDLNRRRDLVNREYVDAFNNLSDEEKPAARREAAKVALTQFKLDEGFFMERYRKMIALRNGVESLNGAAAIVNTLVWDDGYPLDGLSELSRWIDEKFVPVNRRATAPAFTPSWVQAASESTWSAWAGPSIDLDGDRALDFSNGPLPAGSWTRELNFLATLNGEGQLQGNIPANRKLRIAIQWREPHDPNVVLPAEPIVSYELQLLRQDDPTGMIVASDEMTLVARSDGAPVRLMRTESSGVYEQVLEVTVPTDGRYALRVVLISGTASRFGSQTRFAEVFPKIVVRNLNEPVERTVFQTFVTPRPGVGLPGDSAAAFTVGRCDAQGRSLSMLGAGSGLMLRNKPDALIFGDNANGSGSGVAAGTMAGFAASIAEVNVRPLQFVGTSAITPYGQFVLPPEWTGQLAPKP